MADLGARLRRAARLGDAATLQQLLAEGSSVLDAAASSGESDAGRTALHLASKAGAVPCVELLLDAGADACAVDGEGRATSTTYVDVYQRSGLTEIYLRIWYDEATS